MNTLMRIARKEFNGFFSSPVAYIFFAAFLGVTLFIFFWLETFFARNIADVRPLFDWMPALLIFLSAALTMRAWAEERRTGTLEFLLTSPVRPVTLVLGKFIAYLGLVAVALLLTLPLPITVSILGPLDWGPVGAGYLATFFLAAAYLAIGLFISVRSENQIISLIGTVLACALLYLPGSETLTSLVGNRAAEILSLFGSGSRFESITRGVIDLRDLYFYCSVCIVFLSLNVYGLERIRWAGNRGKGSHRHWNLLIVLLIANALAANFWLAPINTLRFDVTRDKLYSISPATRQYLRQLKEPLLIRGYFSAQTHPLLAPLVPRLRDLLKEYQVAGAGKVRVEFIDPLKNPELEQEAGQKYGIRPVPFETSSKYQSSVTNSYFDILVKYGDQFETLGFRDLIEVKAKGVERDLEVELRNPEYDITRAIKKVLYSYRGSGNLFAGIKGPVTITGYLSPDNRLPEQLVGLKKDLTALAKKLKQSSQGRVTLKIVDPDRDGGKVAREITRDYGFRPMALSLLDTRTFWFYITMKNDNRVIQVPLPQDFSADGLQHAVNAALKRFSRGFLKTVALYTPPSTPPMPQYGIPARGKHFELLRQVIGQDYTVLNTDLKDGRVPDEADFLLLAAPESLNKKQVFAVDQFLMQGGTVAIATAPFDVSLQGQLAASKHQSGLEDWLASLGLTLDKAMILDEQNSAFPVPMERQVGMFKVRETKLINYPYFLDIRRSGMTDVDGLLSGIQQLTMNWASPIGVDKEKNSRRRVVQLLHSSPRSWTSDSLKIQPDFERFGNTGFKVGEPLGPKTVGVMVEGKFTSWFTGKPSPLLAEKKETSGEPKDKTVQKGAKEKKDALVVGRVLEHSPESARILLFASNTFLTDTSISILSSVLRTGYEAPVQLMSNCVDWSLEDRGLLAIRGRSQFARTLMPMEEKTRMFWEYLNYGLAMAGLFLIWIIQTGVRKRSLVRYRQILDNTGVKA
ncbi:MAG TPA: ABC transporter permease [Desulfobulbus sp.]|nr:ABC transporter permease [Desulfobulbus sp.]